MSHVKNLCIICQDDLTARTTVDNLAVRDICDTCRQRYADEIEREPLPAWLIAARDAEYERRRSERRALQEVEDRLSDPALSEVRLAASAQADPAVDTTPDVGTFASYRQARAFLDAYQAAHPGYWSYHERLAVDLYLIIEYKAEYGDENGRLPRQPTWDERQAYYNQAAAESGQPGLSKSRLRAVTRSGLAKLRALGWRLHKQR
jgi:hypothetical protein